MVLELIAQILRNKHQIQDINNTVSIHIRIFTLIPKVRSDKDKV